MVIAHYEERQKVQSENIPVQNNPLPLQELMLENSTLREMLCGMEKELVSMLNQRYDTSPPRLLENGDTEHKVYILITFKSFSIKVVMKLYIRYYSIIDTQESVLNVTMFSIWWLNYTLKFLLEKVSCIELDCLL